MFLDEKETRLTISGPSGELESIINTADPKGLLVSKSLFAVVCHPHPLHGGTMENKVVTTLMRTYRDLGVHVLRFNFRGVGKSQGEYDDAIGELEDLRSVIVWVKKTLPHFSLMLAGFSFGSSIAARASYDVPELVHLTLVAPPVERYAYDTDGVFNSPVCVIQGDKDDLVMADGVYAWVESLKSPTILLRYPDAGHFFHGLLSTLKSDLSKTLLTQIAN